VLHLGGVHPTEHESVPDLPDDPLQDLRPYMNAQEFAEIAEKHSGFVYNVAYRMMGNYHDAEEVAQDAFVSAYKARDRFHADALPTTGCTALR
jgi:DNA-directed RNA polymerase specialized sigma24 family protein